MSGCSLPERTSESRGFTLTFNFPSSPFLKRSFCVNSSLERYVNLICLFSGKITDGRYIGMASIGRQNWCKSANACSRARDTKSSTSSFSILISSGVCSSINGAKVLPRQYFSISSFVNAATCITNLYTALFRRFSMYRCLNASYLTNASRARRELIFMKGGMLRNISRSRCSLVSISSSSGSGSDTLTIVFSIQAILFLKKQNRVFIRHSM